VAPLWAPSGFGYFARLPVTEMQVFLDFPAFVTVFLGLFGVVIRFAEWMLRTVPDYLEYDFQRFRHMRRFLSQDNCSVSRANALPFSNSLGPLLANPN
jgi:hypothetical protein